MERFTSLSHVPAETRRLLRDRLRRFLPSYRTPPAMVDRALLDDELVLGLLLGMHIDRESELNRARATYEANALADDGEPSFQDLINDGWIRIVWGRVSAPIHMRVAAAPERPRTRFNALMAKRHGQTLRFSDDVRAQTGLATVIEAMERDGGVVCQTPEWVAARLWDRASADSGAPISGLRLWVDRWRTIGAPSIVPSHAWSASFAETFRESALEVLATVDGLDGWNEAHSRIVSELALSVNQPTSTIELQVPTPPATAVGRALWLGNNQIERPLMEGLVSCGDFFGLLRLLLADVRHTDLSSAPNKLAERIIALALDRPDLMHMLILAVRQDAELIADLLFCPSTSVLACLLVAQWESPLSAWDRELTLGDHQNAKASAFADAVSVMGHFLKQEQVSAAEVAALLTWFHSNPAGRTAGPYASADAMLETLRSELLGQPANVLGDLAAAMAASLPNSGLGTPAFAAVLDAIDTGGLADRVDPSPIVDAYVRSIAEGGYNLTAHRITQGSALSLSVLATRLSPERRHGFLYPVDVKGRLSTGSQENPYTLADNIARSIRAHIRVLSRAIAGSTESVPDELVDALAATIRMGAVEHKEKGRIAAFAPRFEAQTLDRPIAADIGAALSGLSASPRERVLVAILGTDEPMVLAQLSTFVPHALRGQIEKRVLEISPLDAGEVWSLTEVQARIDQLLAAGMSTAAARFMEEERNIGTLGKPPGRAMTRLFADLRLHLIRGDWQAITETQPPPDLSQMEESSAADTISFFRAISELKRPDGDVEGAEQLFARLCNRHPETAAYAVNLFAARISLLLRPNAFAVLEGAGLARGRELLAEADKTAPRIRGAADWEVFASNMALLRLAVGLPDLALHTLTPLRGVNLKDTIAAYTAVALARLGRVAEAVAGLKAAEDSFGLTDVLRAAGEHVRNGSAFSSIASVALENDSIPGARLARLDFLQMDHERQAQVLSSEPEPFDGVMIDCIRSSAESVVWLAPVIRSGAGGPGEDDLTAVIGRVLAAHVLFMGWTLGPSPGGVTARGNPGRRDLVLQKGSTTLAVVEAVLCNRPVTQEWSRAELTSHFQKLLAYSTCRLFFHLSYATIEGPASIIEHLRQAAKDPPAGFDYIDCKNIEQTDSRPTGLVARYRGEFGDVKVVFLVLDFGQHIQRNAAKLANSTNPRNRNAGSRD